MKFPTFVAHTTSNELAFINNLCTYSKVGPLFRRPVLLRKYLDAMPLRKHWGDINQATVRGRVLELLDTKAGAI